MDGATPDVLQKVLFIVLAHLVVAGVVWSSYGQEDPYGKAHLMIAQGDMREGLRELQGVVRRQPLSVEAHYRLGALLLLLGEAGSAEKQLRYAKEMGWDPAVVNPRLAQSYMMQGRYRDMLRDFPALGLPPMQATVMLSMRSIAQTALGDVAAALVSALAAEQIMPDALPPKLAIAHIALARDDPDWAEVKIDQALALNALSPEALLMKGQLLNRRGDREGALALFNEAIGLNPNVLLLRLERANALMAQTRDAEARPDVDFVLRTEPMSVTGNYLDAVLLVRAEDFMGADQALTRIRRELPRFPLGEFYLGLVKYNIGQAEQAALAARRFLAANPADAQALKLFAVVELAGRRPTQVIATLGKALEGGLGDGESFDLLGRAYVLAQMPLRAIESFEQANLLMRDNAEIRRRIEQIRINLVDARS